MSDRAVLTVGSLFAGIGGFDLGLERAGMKVIWQSEIDPYASAVLKKHWPDVPNYGDIRGITAGNVERPSVLCGGFPCQDISNAGKRAGIDGERSGLWSEYARIIGELRPRYVIVENVAALLGRGLERVLGDLAALGFDAEWHCIPASAVGAPHRRDRLWIIANSKGGRAGAGDGCGTCVCGGRLQATDYPKWENAGEIDLRHNTYHCGVCNAVVADAISVRRPGPGELIDACDCAPRIQRKAIDAFHGCGQEQWGAEPDVGRVANGVPSRVDRLRCLGNAIVPQIAEIIGRAIVSQCRKVGEA